MASAHKNHGNWVAKWKDADGRWRYASTSARTKVDCARFARELEAKGERQRLGLEPHLAADGGGSVADLLRWWLETYSTGTPSHATNKSAVQVHLVGSELASLRLAALRSQHVERFLQSKGATLGPQSVNHLRSYLSRAFMRAKEAGRWEGANPVANVRRRLIPKGSFDYLRREEVGPVLAALAPRWRPLFATAIYTGGRLGELCALRKSDVDFGAGLATFARSWDRTSTKSGKARSVPVNPELVPLLREAVLSSNSDLVFPNLKGEMHARDVDFPTVLRRGLARAGIVTGYLHVCRARVSKSGRRDPTATRCGHSELAPDKAPRRCPQHGDLLWPKAQVRPIRFHDLRHTCASLLLQAGCSLPVVSRVLGHADVRITLERYGHLAPDFMQSEVAKLRLGVEAPVAATAAGESGGSSCAGVAAFATEVPEGSPTQAPENEKARDYRAFRHTESGAGNRIRTGDPQLGKLMLYQLSYSRKVARRSARDSTCRQDEARRARLTRCDRRSPAPSADRPCRRRPWRTGGRSA